MEKTAPPNPTAPSKSKRDKAPRYYHVDKFVALIKRWCLQNKRAAETNTSPKPANYRTPQKYLSPGSSVSKNRQILVDREKSNVALPPPRLLVKDRLL